MCTDSTVGYSVANDAKKRYKLYCSQMRAWNLEERCEQGIVHGNEDCRISVHFSFRISILAGSFAVHQTEPVMAISQTPRSKLITLHTHMKIPSIAKCTLVMDLGTGKPEVTNVASELSRPEARIKFKRFINGCW